MLLKNLINNLKPNIPSPKIKGISFDSRNIKKGDLFVSIKGNTYDGNDYIKQAVQKGAKAVVYSSPVKKNQKAVFIKVKNTRDTLAKLSAKYYAEKPKNIVAVTGTNGKTSVSDFFHQIFILQKRKVGFIGTLGFKKNKFLKRRNLTTLDPVNLNKDLRSLKKSGINNVIIEASSHGLKQKRLDFLNIKVGIFTNLSIDHLDYHKNIVDYLNSKLLLFSNLLKKNGTVITDTDIKQYKAITKIQKKKKFKILTIGSQSNIFEIIKHEFHKNFQVLELKYKNKTYKLKINLFGSIQIKNLLMAIIASKVCGLKIEKIFNKIEKIKSIEGRLELIKTLPNQSKVFLDYAHTPDALENAILSLKQHFKNNITVVFGCGGERDKSKRKLMGKVAKKYCDKIIITDDNPRNESPKKIRKEILKGLVNTKVNEIGSRKKAILFALKKSNPNEVILIAGKGHEVYQDFGRKKIFLSDKKIIRNFKIKNKRFKKNSEFQSNRLIINKVLKNKKKYLFDGVSINSKTIKDKNLFIAIKGKRNDGHNFLSQAIKKGATFCVVSKKNKKNSKYIRVKNTMNFLKELAKKKRDTSLAKFIAVTGSSGKTTVKTMLGNLLKKFSKTYFSPESYNNQYGVPLSICNIKTNDNYCVQEVGMNKFKEIDKLSSIVRPHIGIITNISEAHLANFRNIKDIAKAKSEIIYNIEKGGTIILNRDDKFFNYFKKIAKNNNVNIISFGYSKNSDVKFENIKKNKGKILLRLSINKKENLTLNVNNLNKSYIMNVLCCVAVIKKLNLNLKKIKNFFKNQIFLKGRGKISEVKRFNKKFFLVDESYNANPLSVKSAIQNFSNIKKNSNNKYFLFGDMLELGKNSDIYHKKISKYVNKSDIDKTFVYGKESIKTYKLLKKSKRGEIVKNFKDFYMKISKILKNGDFLMIKGSNATKLYEVSNKLLKGQINAV